MVLDTLYKLTDDFVVLSAMESFYLRDTAIHRDCAGEIRTLKLSFYLEDLSRIEYGPLWCIPGSQNIYDRYSTAIACNVAWPPPRFSGDGYLEHNQFFVKHAPVKYFTATPTRL